jgi:uncharacterized phage protein (TIGR02218 family)
MRQISENLIGQDEGQATTLCNAWRLTRIDGVVLGFTDHDHLLEFDGTQFKPESGFSPSSARTELGLNIDEGEVAGAFSNLAITEQDLASGRYDGALVEVFLLNWQDTSSALKLRTQEIGEVSFGDHIFQAELRSLAHRLDQPQGRNYGRKCSANLGDTSCKVDLASQLYKGSGTVIASNDERTCIVDGLAAYEEFWFRYGLMTWTSGVNIGLSVEVHNHQILNDQTILTFFSPLASLATTGDTFEIEAGCAKTFLMCGDKFSNGINFQGFPHLPGSDFAYGYVDEETIHDGRPLVL